MQIQMQIQMQYLLIHPIQIIHLTKLIENSGSEICEQLDVLHMEGPDRDNKGECPGWAHA